MAHGRAPFTRLALAVVLVLVGACEGGGTPNGEPSAGVDGAAAVEGGTVIFAAQRQPRTLNAVSPGGAAAVNELIWSAVLSPLWRITPIGVYEPLLLEGEPELGTDPFSVTYTLREDLQWSDGEPLTAEDVVFTHETIVANDVAVAAREGHRLVSRTEVLGDRKVRFEFRRPFAGWRAMFSEPRSAVLPRHLLAGKTVADVWDERIPVASGPFEFDTWQRGQRLVLKRNESYWGPRAALDEVILTFHDDAKAQISALDSGDADVANPDAHEPELEDLSSDTELDIRPGLQWEALDFNLTAAPTNKAFVRTAIARAIDREALAGAHGGDVTPTAKPLNNVLLLAGHPAYADHWSSVIAYDPAAAEDLLVRNGCVKPDDVYVCDGRPLTLEYLTTADVDSRIELFDQVREDLAVVGIKLLPRLVTSDELRATAARDDSWNLLGFWRPGHPNVWDTATAWRCDAPRAASLGGYCNQAAHGLLEAAGRIVDREQRDRLWNEADAVIARDVPTVPLFQLPTVLAWNRRIEGPSNNPTAWGPLWNVGDWRLTQ